MKSYSFLQDRRFLEKLNSLHIKQQFVKITVLNWNEQPIREVQGTVISGSVNLDGNSSMRRTASLSIFAQEHQNNLDNIDHLFAINKKCSLELGIVNKVSNDILKEKDELQNIIFTTIDYQDLYGDIIWFPLGIYVMFNPSISHSLQGINISMQLKDKMCLLNGDLGGEIHSAVVFSEQDQFVNADSLTLEKNPVLIYNIIKQLVNHWGNEQLSKIIISEVPLQIKRVVKWGGDKDVYVVNENAGTQQGSFNWHIHTSYDFNQDNLLIEGTDYYKFEPGYDMGYTYQDFVYPGELACNTGETVTSVLDKIIGIMGNYQYFYDVFGNFIFQEKQNYLNMTNVAYWTKETNGDVGNLPSDVYLADYYRLTKPVYDFTESEYVTNFNNSLNYNNIKNDFVVWGYRQTTTGGEIGCRFHLAIDKKPQLNKHNIAIYYDSSQVARGVYYNSKTGKPAIGDALFPKASKQTEKGIIVQIAEDRQSTDWRQEIYYQMLEDQYNGTGTNTELNNTYFQYYPQLKEEFPKIFNLLSSEENSKIATGYIEDVDKHPDMINYYLDFIDENSQLGQYSVSNIGRRSKIIDGSNQKINCVFEPLIPDIVYIDTTKYTDDELSQITSRLTSMGQVWTQIPSVIYNLFETGGILNSCFEKIKDLLYQYTHINNTVSLTVLPIYYLEPNTRVTIEDRASGIFDDYIIQSISLPLDISSTMNISVYKAQQKI